MRSRIEEIFVNIFLNYFILIFFTNFENTKHKKNMKTVNFKDLTGIKFNGGTSYRSVLKNDGLGFALMKTVINKGGGYKWHYQNHKEACTCISGKGYLIDLTTNQKHEIFEGITYLVDNHQPHIFFAETEVILISVFNPPLNGNETHDQNGNYNL